MPSSKSLLWLSYVKRELEIFDSLPRSLRDYLNESGGNVHVAARVYAETLDEEATIGELQTRASESSFFSCL